jgi:hypothetical protein
VRVDEEEPRAQVPEEVVAAHESADDVQPGLGLEAVDESAVRLLPLGVTEVVEAGGRDGPFEQLVGVECDERRGPADARGHVVDPPDPLRPRERHLTHAGGHGIPLT